MDPNQCAADGIRYARTDDATETRAALRDLREWIARGGFRPSRRIVRQILDNLEGREFHVMAEHDPNATNTERAIWRLCV